MSKTSNYLTVPLLPCPCLPIPAILLWIWCFFWNYLRLLRKYRPVALVSFTVKSNIYGGFAARLLGIPQIGNISGLGTAFIEGGWLGRMVMVLYRIGIGAAFRIFFQNPDDRDFFLANGLVKPEQAGLLPGSGVDLGHFSPTARPSNDSAIGVAQRPFGFLYIGRMLGDKGLKELVAAVGLLKSEGLAIELGLLGAQGGTNPSAISEAQLADWQQQGVVEYLGATDDVRPEIARADCVVLPSYREGTPRSLLEAAAMAKPLIATDVPGCRQVVKHGENGFLCLIKDPRDLALVMRRMMALSLQERANMGRASRLLAEREFDEQKVVEQYLDALGDALFAR